MNSLGHCSRHGTGSAEKLRKQYRKGFDAGKKQAAGTIAQLRTQLAAVEKERDEARAYEIDFTGRLNDQIKINDNLKAQLKRHKEALEAIKKNAYTFTSKELVDFIE